MFIKHYRNKCKVNSYIVFLTVGVVAAAADVVAEPKKILERGGRAPSHKRPPVYQTRFEKKVKMC